MRVYFTYEPGGVWQPIEVHSVLLPGGVRWDEYNRCLEGIGAEVYNWLERNISYFKGRGGWPTEQEESCQSAPIVST